MNMHFPILKDLGLAENEALIYEILLELGPKKASNLVKPSQIARGNVYNVLMQLQTKGLVLVKEGKHQVYEAVDPAKLRDLLELKLKEAKRLEAAFADTLPSLNSTFNLSTGKPAIQIFEGIDGAKTALYDSLTSKTEILTYFDVSALRGPMASINKTYVRKRIEKKIDKRIIVADTEEARTFFDQQKTSYTRVAYLKEYPERHATGMEIYDDTISYLTLTDEKRISLLIKDQHMYEMHKQQFDFLWSLATEVIDYAARANSASTETHGSNAT